MLQSIERYMKQAIVDKEPSVSSAALTSSLVSLSLAVCLSVCLAVAALASSLVDVSSCLSVVRYTSQWS